MIIHHPLIVISVTPDEWWNVRKEESAANCKTAEDKDTIRLPTDDSENPPEVRRTDSE